jgi:hypothetical protein
MQLRWRKSRKDKNKNRNQYVLHNLHICVTRECHLVLRSKMFNYLCGLTLAERSQ